MMNRFWTAYAQAVLGDFVGFQDGDGGRPEPGLPPGTPPTLKYTGPWFQTQLTLASTIGLISCLLFTYARTRWLVLFAPRTKLKGFSPHDAHTHSSWFAWVLPTIKTSEFTVLQIVGLDAAVLLNFFKMSFYLFSVAAILICAVMVPLNIYFDKDSSDDDLTGTLDDEPQPTPPLPDKPDWYDIVNATNSFRATQLLFTYIFTGLILRFLYRNYRRFVRTRQLYSLELVHSIAGRTVMVTDLPPHLQGEKKLAIYFENMDLQVESVNIVREANSLKILIEKRTEALLCLEHEWTRYVGNPSTVGSYDPSQNVRSDTAPLVDIGGTDAEAQPVRVVVPHRPRPTVRPGWFKPKVDALEYYERQFQDFDEQVRKKRKTGKFKATNTAFVTFEKMSDAQIAAQVVHAPYQHPTITCLAPEPRDIVWANMTLSPRTRQARKLTVFAFMVLLFLFWIIPITTISAFLSYDEIKKTLPWLGKLIDRNDKIRAIVQNSLPSMAMVMLNASLPVILEGFAYLQGYQARSWIEYSLMRKYFLFLLVNVVFIFLFTSTYIQLVRDLADSPAKIPTKLAAALSKGKARSFFMSYVVLQALGIMPLQLLNLGVVLPRIVYLFFTRTPRDFAELNAPPMINYGAVYPQALLVFVITVLYSIIQPFILVFGALYFGIGYVVYKYKLLFVFYKPYESHGQAWPITFTRLMWGVIIFQLLMTGIFTLEQYFTLAAMMAPLIAFTTYWTWNVDQDFAGFSDHVSLSSVFEVQRGENSEDVVRLRSGHPVTWSQSHLNRRRYAQNDETLYVAPEDDRTDYSQPPMSNWYPGVLNTGKRRYGHPALTGVLPTPWLPLKKGETLANYLDRDSAKAPDGGNAVVLTLRRRFSQVRKRGQALFTHHQVGGEMDAEGGAHEGGPAEGGAESSGGDNARAMDPWKDRTVRPISVASAPASPGQPSQPSQQVNRLSFDPASGVIVLPEDDWFFDSEDDYGDSTPPEGTNGGDGSEHTAGGTDGGPSPTSPTASAKRHSTYFHHPERRKTIPGAFPRG